MRMRFKRYKLVLVDDWRLGWRFWSIRFSAAGAILLSLAELAPGAIASVWTIIPSGIQDEMPTDLVKWMGIGLMFASPIARVIKQHKLERYGDELHKHDKEDRERIRDERQSKPKSTRWKRVKEKFGD